MNGPSRCKNGRISLRQKIIGLGERSIQKSYYPQLRQKLEEVELAREKLAESEARHRSLVENINDVIISVDASGVVTYVSPVIQRLCGLAPERITGRPFTELVYSDDRSGVVRSFERALGGRLELHEFRLSYKEGAFRYARISCRPLVDKEQAAGLTCVMSDITERKRTEQELFLMSFALNNVREAAFLTDEIGRFRFVNEHACRTLGYTRGELLGMGVADIDPDFPSGRWTSHWRELRSQRSLSFESRQKTKEGRIFPVEISANYFEYDNEAYNLALVRDITARKRHEEHVQQLMREVNHRSKNLLSVIQAIVRMTEAAGTPADFVQRFEERLGALAASQDLLVRSDWSGVEIEALVRSQLAHFEDRITSRVSLSGPPLLLLSSTAQTLGMAVHELATNAGKYGSLSSETGRVQIAWATPDNVSGRRFTMEWKESGGPAVSPPTRRGFGSIVIRDMVRMGLDAELDLNYAPTGLVWSVTAPLDKVIGREHARRLGR